MNNPSIASIQVTIFWKAQTVVRLLKTSTLTYRMLAAEMSWLQRIAGITRLHKIRNDDIRQALDSQTTLQDKIVQRRL